MTGEVDANLVRLEVPELCDFEGTRRGQSRKTKGRGEAECGERTLSVESLLALTSMRESDDHETRYTAAT